MYRPPLQDAAMDSAHPWTVRIQVRVYPLPQSFVDLMESSSTFLDGSTYYVVSPPYI